MYVELSIQDKWEHLSETVLKLEFQELYWIFAMEVTFQVIWYFIQDECGGNQIPNP